GRWRGGSSRLGVRSGIAGQDFGDDVTSLCGGLDGRGRVTRASADFPLEVDWVAGAGFGIEDDVLLTFPFGVTLGRRLPAEGATFTPYGTPRLMVDACIGDDDDLPPRRGCFGGDDIDLDFAIDLGV